MLATVKDLVGLLRRIAVTIAGIVILAVGAVLLVAPGPGLLVIALALSVFAVEYRWAISQPYRYSARSAALKPKASTTARSVIKERSLLPERPEVPAPLKLLAPPP
jgi:hypothetical protein